MTLASADVKSRIIRRAILSRRVEERLLELFSEGKLFGTVHTCIGQEFVGGVVGEFFKRGDYVFSNHRCHGHFLSTIGDVKGLIAELMGRSTGVCGGRGGSQHLCKDGFFSNGIQGGIVPVAAGLALAQKNEKPGHVSICFVGDGTLGEGTLYETLNIASKWQLPLLIILENNGYAQSTNQQQTLAGGICDRAKAFDIPTFHGDTWNWQGLYATMGEAFERVRSGSGPAFVQVDTYRLKAHSKGDDNRPKEIVEPFVAKDPLNVLSSDAATKGLYEELQQVVDCQVKEAVELADKAPQQPIAVVPSSDTEKLRFEPLRLQERERMVKALNRAFTEALKNDPRVFFMGEDVESPYGGAFKVAQGLSQEFPQRCVNTPISEAAIVGIANGMALAGMRPFVEIMFGDFITLATDQLINHAAKFRYMYNDQVHCPVLVRTPMGGGRGYGPTHSQSIERLFLGVPGLQVVAVNQLVNYEPWLKNFLSSTESLQPTLQVENKLMYGRYTHHQELPYFEYQQAAGPDPIVWIRPKAVRCHLTLVGYGGTSELLLEVADRLFREHETLCQVIIPWRIYPFDVGPLLHIIQKAPLLATVEEGQGFAGFGSELLTQVAQRLQGSCPRLHRVLPRELPIPSAFEAEKQSLPVEADYILNELRNFVRER